jgi:hypothetical protein
VPPDELLDPTDLESSGGLARARACLLALHQRRDAFGAAGDTASNASTVVKPAAVVVADVAEATIARGADGNAEVTPPDAKAIFPVVEMPAGPLLTQFNPKLRMFLTSVGMLETSAPEMLESYRSARAQTPGKGVLILLDAKLKTLQWSERGPSDPAVDNDAPHVTYRREPDVPGGRPVLDASGKPVPKTQAELAKTAVGYQSVEWGLRHDRKYSFGGLEVTAKGEPGERVPVYLSYLAYYNSAHGYHICLAKGYYQDGEFTMLRADGTGPFSEADYEEVPVGYSAAGNSAFAIAGDEEFKAAVDSVNTVWSCGGVTWGPVNQLQPFFVDDGHATSTVNPYGTAVLNAVRAGEVIYVGQSAGTVCMSANIGPLTTDPRGFVLETRDEYIQKMDFAFELGDKLLEPGLGAYVGIPYNLTFRPHLTFNPETLRYAGRALGTIELARELSDGIGIDATHNVYCVTLADYDYFAGQGDVLEVRGEKVIYHVGYSDKTDPMGEDTIAILKQAGHSAKLGEHLRRQPAGNPPSGWQFEWTPEMGEVHAAGPNAQRPFRPYADHLGPMRSMPPC